MIPVKFEYATPATLEEAIGLLAATPDARVVAGAQSLIPAMSARRLTPSLLVDLRAIPGLRGVEGGAGLRIGALTTLGEVASSDAVRAGAAALADAAVAAGDIQVRHLGTIGGALADGHPAGDLIAAAIVLDASVTLVGPSGSRTLAAASLVTGPFRTAIAPDEVLTSIAIPAAPARTGSAYLKMRHPGSGYAICGAAAAVSLAADGTVASVRLALTGATDHPIAVAVALHASGAGHSAAQAAHAASKAAGLAGPFTTDLAAAGDYRGHLAGVLADRAVHAAAHRAREA